MQPCLHLLFAYNKIRLHSGILVYRVCNFRLRGRCPRGGGGYTDIFIQVIRRLASFSWVSKFLISTFSGVFREMNIFGGMKILWIFFGGHHKIGLYLGGIKMHFRVFF